MAKKDIPFDDDVMTMIMGVGGPDESGQHGRTKAPMPTEDTVTFITTIRDMCDDYLKKIDKEDKEDKDTKDASEKTPEDTEGMEEEE